MIVDDDSRNVVSCRNANGDTFKQRSAEVNHAQPIELSSPGSICAERYSDLAAAEAAPQRMLDEMCTIFEKGTPEPRLLGRAIRTSQSQKPSRFFGGLNSLIEEK